MEDILTKEMVLALRQVNLIINNRLVFRHLELDRSD